jgi:hypothetical protein
MFTCKSDIHKDHLKAMFDGKIVVDIRPQKAEKECTQFTAGGNLIDYPWEVTTPTADLTMSKLLFNSVVSTPGATFLMMDIQHFYLNTPMKCPEFMRLKADLILQ